MTDDTLDLTEQLAAELAANDEEMTRDEIEAAQAAPRLVDTKSMPVRFHHLKEMARSPAHCLASFSSKYANDSLAMRIGSGTHALLFGQPYAVFTGKQRRKGTDKKPSEWDLFSAQHAGKVIMNSREHAQAKAICTAIKSHEIAHRLLFSPGVVYEEQILWEQSGRARRSTPDARGAYHLVDLKTARSVEPRAFARDAFYRSYFSQLADYSSAIEALTGVKPREVYIVAVESAYPYVVQCYQLTTQALERGAKLVRDWLDRLTLCETTGIWEGYSGRVEALEMFEPFKSDDDDDEDEVPWKETA